MNALEGVIEAIESSGDQPGFGVNPRAQTRVDSGDVIINLEQDLRDLEEKVLFHRSQLAKLEAVLAALPPPQNTEGQN